ncbi:hypothetical protein [Tessaracoccus lacteus]|uniref:Uncharacterized protein n=1 Tax=Tessaracoccus lacteus TaxID=3041766 RepID=A0ABY8PXM1_9ACTN|nr:hypothetical protein [Tessaracoccus sp. T21]WGT47219.1 hypothetical protein QH948_00025 [Tessaracoccus sp. T21]
MLNNEQRPPAGELEGIKVQVADLWPIVPENNFRRATLASMLGPFGRRAIEEMILTGLPSTWERRAADFLWIQSPVPEKRQEHEEIAAACLERAELIRRYPEDFSLLLGIPELVADVWAEGVAA